tara:strand:+ start:1440 stop:1925 length:486 start_codon:yes stop_codon:yes gene_type:complete
LFLFLVFSLSSALFFRFWIKNNSRSLCTRRRHVFRVGRASSSPSFVRVVVVVVVVFWAAGAVARFGGTLFPREKSASTEPVASRLICWNDFASRRDATKEEDEEQSAAEEDEDKKRWEDSSRETVRRGDVFNAPGGWFLRRCFIPNGHLSVKRRSGKKDDQ